MASSCLVVRPCDLGIEVVERARADSGEAPCVSSSTKSVAPWLMLPPESEEDCTLLKFHRLDERDVISLQFEQQPMTPDVDSRCFGTLPKGWLVCIQPKDCVLFLFNPLSCKTILLPSIETFPCVKGIIRNSDTGLVEGILNHGSRRVTPQFMSTYIVKNMVLSSPHIEEEDCIAMVIYGSTNQLAYCRTPAAADSWTVLDQSPLEEYCQIVFHTGKKLFFAFTDGRNLEAWDLHSDPVKRFVIQGEYFGTDSWPYFSRGDDERRDLITEYCWEEFYLVYHHQSQELFIVTRYIAHGVTEDATLLLPEDNNDHEYPYQTQAFDVFKLDFIDHDHVELQYLEGSLGDRAFFIGSNPGFALSTAQFPELRPNSIYYTDNLPYGEDNITPNCGGHDLGIYDYKEDIFLPCYYSLKHDRIQKILPNPKWFTPDDYATCLASTLALSF